MEDDWMTYPYLLGSGWGTTLTITTDKPKKIKKNPVGFHSPRKVKKDNGRRTA